VVAGVVIGIDPHKGSHTAVVIDGREKQLAQLRIRSSARQADELLRWARQWRQRTWAVEGAHGLGQLLTQQLLGAGEVVLDVPPKLAARVRLLNSGQINKTDPNDARSVAIAALRARTLPAMTIEDQTVVLRIWSRRFHDLARLRTQAVCRLHSVLCELIPGGVRKQLRTSQAIAVVDAIDTDSPVEQAKLALARELVADLQRIDAQRREVKRRITAAVTAAHSSITDVYGVGPIVAATVLGQVRDIRRFPSPDRFASYNGTAPIKVASADWVLYRLSRRGNRQLNHAIHVVAVSQISHTNNDGYAYYHRKRAEGMTKKSALRALKRRISDTLYRRLREDTQHRKDPGGHSGNDAVTSVAGSHPAAPALRKSHSRATTNSRTTHREPLTPRPAPDKRRTSRSATGVKLEPRTGPATPDRAGPSLTPASTGRPSQRRSRPTT
jgi:transposase